MSIQSHEKASCRTIKVISATEYISEGADGILLECVLEGIAEYYSADLSEKVIRGQTENAQFRDYDVWELETRRRLIDSFVNSVFIYDDYILITSNYKDDLKQISFSDINGSDLVSLDGPNWVWTQFTLRLFIFLNYGCTYIKSASKWRI